MSKKTFSSLNTLTEVFAFLQALLSKRSPATAVPCSTTLFQNPHTMLTPTRKKKNTTTPTTMVASGRRTPRAPIMRQRPLMASIRIIRTSTSTGCRALKWGTIMITIMWRAMSRRHIIISIMPILRETYHGRVSCDVLHSAEVAF